GGLSAVHSFQGEQDPNADIAVLPVACVQPVHLRLSPGHVVSSATIDSLFVDESVLDQGVEVVTRRADREPQRPRDGPEMIARKQAQVIVDLPTNGVLESREQAETNQERASPVRDVASARSG